MFSTTNDKILCFIGPHKMNMSHYFSVLNTLWNFFYFRGLPPNFEIFPTFNVLTRSKVLPLFSLESSPYQLHILVNLARTVFCCSECPFRTLEFALYPIKTSNYHDIYPRKAFLEAEFCFVKFYLMGDAFSKECLEQAPSC